MFDSHRLFVLTHPLRRLSALIIGFAGAGGAGRSGHPNGSRVQAGIVRAARALGVMGVVGAVGGVGGCGFTVEPPAAPDQPVTVFLARQGVHTSLLLPRDNGTLAHYSYSRWDWAALDRDQFYRAPFAVLMPGPGALGYRDMHGPATYDHLAACPDLWGDAPPKQGIYPIEVSAAACRLCLSDLDARWKLSQSTALYNQKRDMTFVQDGASYSMGHTCNTETAQWLRELGCKVTGTAMTSDVSVVAPPGGAERSLVRRPSGTGDVGASPGQ